MKNLYEVYCGNIGKGHAGHNRKEAETVFSHYVGLSANGIGRAAGEDVTLFMNGEIVKEFLGEYGA